VKAVRLAHEGDYVRLIGLAIQDTCRQDDEDCLIPSTRRERTIDAIRSVLARSGANPSRPTPVVTAVGGSNVSIKHVTFPRMPEQALAESIQWESKRHVPFGTSDYVLDYQVLERDEDGGDQGMHVLLAAVQSPYVQRHLSLVREAGADPQVVDLVPLALMNQADDQGMLNGEAVAVIEMGKTTAHISIYRRGGFFLARSVPMPRVAPDSAVSYSGSESDGYAADDGDTPWDSQGIAGMGQDSREEWLDFVLREARLSLTFYDQETGRRGIERVLLAGGRSLLPEVVPAFEQTLGIRTELLDPLGGLSEQGADIGEVLRYGPRFALAMGLARRR
jgi:type IV pilus assembly protein PilM